MAADGRRGLGRGLSALLGESEGGRSDGDAGVREIPIELIKRNPDQPRTHFDEAELDELAASMRGRGVLQPILVRPWPEAPGYFQIVAGERRWRAAQKAGLRAVPALVRNLDDQETLEAALIENVQRTDLNPLEEAAAYRTLMDLAGRTQEIVAEAVGKSRSHVANSLRLLSLSPALQTMVMARALSAGHARALIGVPNAEDLARRIVVEGLSVREAEALVRRQAKAGHSRAASAPRSKDADTVALERDLSEALGLKVEIVDKDGAGEVRIRYGALEQLEDICRRLMKV